MKKRVFKFIEDNNLINDGDRIGVGVSGGADSVALLILLHEYKKLTNFDLVVIHVNHNIRGEESDRDQKFVQELCEKLNVPIFVKSVDVLGYQSSTKKTLEQSARELRHNALSEVMAEQNLNKIALAHNLGDQAETILMHIFRGCGLDGLAGMGAKNGNYIRPLINESKKDIEAFLESENVSYVLDSTNKDSKYTRNYLRNEVIPAIQKAYPNVQENLIALSKKAKEVSQFIENIQPKSFLKNIPNGILLENSVKNLDKLTQKVAIRKAFKSIDGIVDIEEKHIDKVLELFNFQVGKRLNMPNGIEVSRAQNGLVFDRKIEVEFEPVMFSLPGKIAFNSKQIEIDEVRESCFGDGNLYFDLDKLPRNVYWRKIKQGDKFEKFSGGTKLLSDFLTDKKIDSTIRRNMIVLGDESEVFIIPSVEISKKLKIERYTKRIARVLCHT